MKTHIHVLKRLAVIMRKLLIHSLKILILVICFLNLVMMTFGQSYIYENFSSGQMPPEGWTINNVAGQWTVSNSNNAGGNYPEARFQWIQLVETTRLISPPIDLTGLTSIRFHFNHMYDDYQGDGPAVGVATRSGGGLWNSVWEILPEANVGPEIIELEIENEDVGQPDFQICCYVQGDLFNLDYWYVDDIRLFGPVKLDVTLFLEGPYVNDQMTNHLNVSGYLPLSQPYSGPFWNYPGTEEVPYIPNSNVTDWVLIELLKPNPYLQQVLYSVEDRKAGFILRNGTITGLDGNSMLSFQLPDTDSLYACIHHRNHLSVMSSTILLFDNGICSYDFTSGSEMAVEGQFALKELSPEKWGVISGDGNADGQINNSDKNDIWLQQTNNNGYFSGDFNMDGEVNENDIDGFWKMNAGRGSWAPDTTGIPLVCGDSLFDVRDGQYYQTVQIGNQCWMEENLNYETGTSWCYYNNTSYCEIYGRLYNWETIMNGAPGSNSVPSGVQGICPDGWHLPSDGEWCILTQYIDPTVDCDATGYNGTDAGIKMKSTMGWSSGGNGTNESGFNALPAGCMGIYHFDDLYLFSYIWSTTEDYPGYAWLSKLNYGLPTVGRYFSHKSRGYSARCIKDE